MFRISFYARDKQYTGIVQKIGNATPVQFVVYDVKPHLFALPEKMIFESVPDRDQLAYCSFHVSEPDVLRRIGEAIFVTCNLQHISVHS